MSDLTLVVGPSGSGKTRFLASLARERNASGILTRRRCGVRRALDLSGGGARRLALRREPVPGDPTPRWAFDPGALAWADAVLARREAAEVWIVDEVGPLEFGGGGWTSAMARLDARDHPPAFVALRPSLVAAALARWPWARILSVG